MGKTGCSDVLNTVLTVRARSGKFHRGIGWEEFTDAAIRVLAAQDRPMVLSSGANRLRVKNPCLTRTNI